MRITKFTSIFILFALLPLFGQEVNWANSWNEAKERAERENKLIMLMVTQSNCRACEFMKYATFTNSDVEQELNSHYVSIALDKSELPESLYVRGTPTFRFYTPKGKRLKYKLIGGLNYKVFLPKLQNLREKFFSKQESEEE
jgi:thioredoxin-related protein